MSEKLKSRKFWVTFVVSAILLFANQLGLNVENVQELVALAIAYVLGQGIADSKALPPSKA